LFFGYKDPNNTKENIRAYQGWNAGSDKLNDDALIPAIKFFNNDKLSAIRVLLKNNANVNIKCDSERSALYWAVLYGHREVVKILLKYKASIHDTNKDKQITLLHITTDTQMMTLLFEAGVNINAPDDYGRTPLYKSVDTHKIETVEWLLSKGANIQCITKSGQSLLHAATSNIDIMKLLITKDIRIDTQDKNGKTALYKAVEEHRRNDSPAVIDLLLSAGARDLPITGNNQPQTALDLAKSRKNMDIEILLQKAEQKAIEKEKLYRALQNSYSMTTTFNNIQYRDTEDIINRYFYKSYIKNIYINIRIK
jgi:ankyrin repeat protein